MSRIEDLKKKVEEENKVLEEVEKYTSEISEVEKTISKVDKAKEVYLELEKKSVLELESLKEKLSEGTFETLFGSTKKKTSKKSGDCSRESINFQTVERLLTGETLFAIAADIYKDKVHLKGDKEGDKRVIEGKPDFDTVYLTGRHIEDFFKKCPEYGRITKSLSKKNGKIYAPLIKLSEVGEKAFK